MGQASICKKYGNMTEWRNHGGELHREDGPAREYVNGYKEWWVNGRRHREDGPAIEWTNGGEWWINGKLHREDGPALELVDGKKEWWVNGKRHRVGGPAIEYADGNKAWYLNGININSYLKCSIQEIQNMIQSVLKCKEYFDNTQER